MKIKLTNCRYFLRKRLQLLIMRMFIFLFCTTVFSLSPNKTFSQEKVIINQEQSVSVDQVFKIIQQQTKYHFIFPKRLFKNSPNILLKKGEITVFNLLQKSLQNSNLEFKLDNNNTILIRKIETNTDIQAKIVVKGKVTDSNGEVLPGVSVIEKGTTNGKSTDFSGNYSISVPKDAVLEFSSLGYQKKTINIADLTYYNNVNVILKEDVNVLDEIVISTGYQKLSKERSTGAFEIVDEKQLQQRPSATFLERIQGQVNGLSVNPSNGKIEIRGRSTVFNGYDDVLIVVDGYPLTRQDDYNTINPEDIKTLTVLKDAAAASVWGARASNGVIVITTKSGDKNKKLSVTYSSFLEYEEKVNLDDMRFLSVAEEIELDQEYIDKGWTNLEGVAGSNSSINDFYLANIYREGLSPDGNRWSQNTFDNYINELKGREDVNRQIEKYLLQNAARQTHNLSLQGGGEKNTYFASMSYTDYKAYNIGNENNRLTINLRNTFDFNENIKFIAGINAVFRNGQENGISIDYLKQLQAYDQIVDENGQYIQKYFNWNPWLSQQREAEVGTPHTWNILEEQRNLDNSNKFLDLRADFSAEIKLFDGFILRPSFRYERGAGNTDNFRNMNLPSHRNTISDYYVNGSFQLPVGSDYAATNTRYEGWTMRNTFNYDKSFGKHDVTVFGGIEYNKRFTESNLNRHFGYNKQATLYIAYNELGLFNYSLRDFTNTPDYDFWQGYFQNSSNSDIRNVSYFANLGYSFDKKYNFTASYRVDQANIFGSDPDFRYKPLWSVGAAWNISNEDFMSNLNWVNRLTLRATHGITGNSLGSASPYATAFSRTNTYSNSYFFSRLSVPANPDLKWEETAKTNFALDFSLFSWLSGSLEYYNEQSTDVYARRPLDPTVGFTSATVNYASIQNSGTELRVNAIILNTNDLEWSVTANINTNNNVVKTFEPTSTTADSFASGNGIDIDAPVQNYYSYNFAGLDTNGEATFFDQNGDVQHWSYEFNKDDLVLNGSKTPRHYGGLSSTIRYKGFDLTANINYGADFAFRYSPNYASVGFGSTNNIYSPLRPSFNNIRVSEIWGDRWMNPGDEATTNVPRVFYNGLNPNTGQIESRNLQSRQDRKYVQSTAVTHQGDYIRVQDIILGYTFNKNVLNKTFFNDLRFTTQVTNPFLWVKNDLGVDPTATPATQAIRNLTRFTFGIRANF